MRPPNQHEDCSFGVLSSSGVCKSRTHDVIVDRRGTTSQLFECRERRRLFIRRRRHRTPSLLVGGATVSILAVTIAVIQLHAYIVEYQGPLDHIIATAVEPYYDMFCPKISNNNDETLEDSHDYNNQSTINLVLSWDCNSGGPTIVDTTTFPRIFMIGARDMAEDTFQEWNITLNRMNSNTMHHDVVGKEDDKSHSSPRLERINTLDISNQYATSGNKLCRKIKWEHRLFAVYQYIFTNLLVTHPDDSGFVIIEDDAILQNVNYFRQDVCYAKQRKLDFYSLYRSPVQLRKRWRSWWKQHSSSSSSSSLSCIYQHGTVAFYIRRTMMEKIVNEHRRNYFCRYPIDMYISKHGPWYATRREIVGHSDMGRVGST